MDFVDAWSGKPRGTSLDLGKMTGAGSFGSFGGSGNLFGNPNSSLGLGGYVLPDYIKRLYQPMPAQTPQGQPGAGKMNAAVTPNAAASALAHSAPYRQMIDQIAPQYAQQAGVDPNEFADTLQALIETENSAPDAESVAGAYGVSQAMPNWYEGLDRSNPQAQIIAGARALASKYQAVGPDSAKAAGAYFGYGTDANGMTTGQYVPIWQNNYNTVRHLPR